MENSRLQYKTKIPLKKSIDKISVYAMWGDHSYQPRPENKKEVVGFLSKLGIDANKLAEDCRDYKQPIPMLENLIGPTWDVHTYKGGKVSIVDRKTGETVTELDAPGKLTFSTYLAQFETACKARDRAVSNSSYMDFHSATIHGFASIESYINWHVQSWNSMNPNDKLIDTKQAKVSFNDKIDIWVPKMSGGRKVEKGDRRWSDFMKLKKERDNKAVHSKQSYQNISYSELSNLINAFRLGMAGMLGQLHLMLSKPLPSLIINAVYMPDVEIGST